MSRLIQHLEDLAEEGIRINFGKGIYTILVGCTQEGGYIYIGPEEENGVIGLAYVTDKVTMRKSNVQYINSSGHGLTQIALPGKGLYTICHTRKMLARYLDTPDTDFKRVTRNEYDNRLTDELDFSF